MSFLPRSAALGAALLLPLAVLPGGAAAQQAAPAPAAAARPADPVTAALALLTAKKLPEAAAALEKLVAQTPEHPLGPLLQVRLGDAQMGLEKPEAAARAYGAALQKKPPAPLRAEALVGLARAEVALRADDKALPLLKEAFDLTEYDEKSGPAAAMLLGDLHTRAGRRLEAAAAYERATRWPFQPEAARAYFQEAEAYQALGRAADAAVAYRITAEKYYRSPLAPRASLAAAELFLDLNRLDEAEAEYRRILEGFAESPEAPRAQLGLGRVAFARGQTAAARASFEGAVLAFANTPVASEAELRIADTYRAEKNLPEARRRYQALAGGGDRAAAAEALYSLGTLYRQQEEFKPAAEAFQRLWAEAQSGRWGHLAALRLAEIRSGAGDDAAAAAILRPVTAAGVEPALRDEAAVALGETLLRLKDYAGAEAVLTPPVQRSPSGEQARAASVALARARLEQKDAAGAVARLDALLKQELPPDLRARALVIRGDALLRLGQAAAGEASLREGLEKYPATKAAGEAARLLLARYRETKQPAKAEEIEKLIAQRYGAAGEAAAALLEQGDAALGGGRYDEARRLFARVLDRHPERASRLRARAGIAEALVWLKEPVSALEQERAEILRDAPPDGFLAATDYRLGRAWEKQGKLDRALTAYEAARKAGPDAETTPGVLVGLGRLLSAAHPQEAQPLLRQVIEKYPRSPLVPDAEYALAWAYEALKRPNDAAYLWSRLVTDHPGHPLAPDARFRLGEREYAQGNYAAAVERYRPAASSNHPVADRAGYKLGWSLRKLERPADAAQAFAAVAQRFPKSPLAPECRVRAGEAFLQAEQDRKALEQFESALAHPAAGDEGEKLALQARVGAAQAHLMQGELDQALELSAGAAVPSNGWYGGRARLVRSEAAFLKNGPRAGAAEFVRAAAVFSGIPEIAGEARFRAGECYARLKERAAAEEAWRQVMVLYPGTVWARKSKARLDGTANTPVEEKRQSARSRGDAGNERAGR